MGSNDSNFLLSFGIHNTQPIRYDCTEWIPSSSKTTDVSTKCLFQSVCSVAAVYGTNCYTRLDSIFNIYAPTPSKEKFLHSSVHNNSPSTQDPSARSLHLPWWCRDALIKIKWESRGGDNVIFSKFEYVTGWMPLYYQFYEQKHLPLASLLL